MKKFLYVLYISTILTSCNIVENDTVENGQNILFEVQYINFAWGYQHSGFYINKKGEVFNYKYDANSAVWKPNKDNYYTEEELLNKYKPNNTLVDTIDKCIIFNKKKLIPQAMQSNYSDTTQIGADQGTTSYICYYYNSIKNKYLEIVLEQDGDWNYKKESLEADSLINWLKDISKK